MYKVNELLTKVTVVEVSTPKKQAAIIATVSNMDGTLESLSVKQVDGRLEDTIKAAIAEAQAALIGTTPDDEAAVVSTEIEENDAVDADAVEITAPEETPEVATGYADAAEETMPTDTGTDTKDIRENSETSEAASEVSEEVPGDFPTDEKADEMAIPDSEVELNALLDDIVESAMAPAKAMVDEFAAELESRVNAEETETEATEPVAATTDEFVEDTVEEVPVAEETETPVTEEAPVTEETSETPADDVTEEETAPVTETQPEATDEEDFMVTIGVHASNPMWVSECAELLRKGNQQERKMLRQAITTLEYMKTRGGNPDVTKQASDYIAYMEARGLNNKEG